MVMNENITFRVVLSAFFSLLLKKCFEAAALIFQSSRFLFAAFIPTPR